MSIKLEMVAADDAGWGEFVGLVESLSPDQMEAPGYFPEGWSVKDLIAHIGGWQAEAATVLEQIRVGTFTASPVDVDAFNQLVYEANKDLPLMIVRAECWAAHTRMLEEWDRLPEVTPVAQEWFVECGPSHYGEHDGRLREWVEELRGH